MQAQDNDPRRRVPRHLSVIGPQTGLTSVPRASTRMLAPIASLTSMLSVGFSSQLRAVNAYGLLVSAPTCSGCSRHQHISISL